MPNKIEEVKGSFLPKLTSVLKDFSFTKIPLCGTLQPLAKLAEGMPV